MLSFLQDFRLPPLNFSVINMMTIVFKHQMSFNVFFIEYCIDHVLFEVEKSWALGVKESFTWLMLYRLSLKNSMPTYSKPNFLGLKTKHLKFCCVIFIKWEYTKIISLDISNSPALALCYHNKFLRISRWYNVGNALGESWICGNFKYKYVPSGCVCVCVPCVHNFLFREGLVKVLWDGSWLHFIALHLEKFWTLIPVTRDKNGPMK